MSGSSGQHMYGRYGQYDHPNTHPSYGYGQHPSTRGWQPGYPSSPAYHHQQPQYGPQPYPSTEDRQSNEHQDRKRKREETPESERNVADKSKKLDWPFLRVFLLDNAAVLLQNLCPRLYGLGTINNAGSKERKYALILLLTQNSQANGKRWRAAVTCDGVTVIEGPERISSDLAVEDLQESVAARLSRVVPRAWEPKKDIHTGSGNVGMEEDGTGTKFLSERVGGRGFGKRN